MGKSGAGKSVAYADEAYRNDLKLGLRLQDLDSGEAIRNVFPPQAKVASFDDSTGYLNSDGGWAHPAKSLTKMMAKVTALGAKIIPKKTVAELIKQDGKTKGVKCADGTEFDASLVILATGAWTASVLNDINLSSKFLATG